MYFLTDLLHLAAANLADKVFLRQAVFHHLGGRPFRDDLQDIAGLPFARMGFHGDLLRSGGFRSIRIGLGFVERKSQLVHEVFLNPFGRRSKLPFFCKPKLLRKPLVLELQFSELCLLRFIFRARNSHHFGSI